MTYADPGFLAGISFEENPYFEEDPEELLFYDLSGNEVMIDAAE